MSKRRQKTAAGPLRPPARCPAGRPAAVFMAFFWQVTQQVFVTWQWRPVLFCGFNMLLIWLDSDSSCFLYLLDNESGGGGVLFLPVHT